MVAALPGAAFTGLPADIAFLARHGVARQDLVAVAARAARLGVEPSCEAIASGTVDEDRFYRALAAELELPFHEGPLRFRPGGAYGAILRQGVAPVLAGSAGRLRFALAPEGQALRHMLEAGPRARDDVAVMTPRAFASCLREANASSLARHVAGLDRAGLNRPSARMGTGRGQKITAGAGVGTTAFCSTLAPLETFFTMALLVGPVFLGLICLRLGCGLRAAHGRSLAHSSLARR